MTELITISFTTPIIRNHRVSSAGPPATVLSHIKKIGISSAASFAFIKFTASGCSKDDSLEGCQCQRLRHHRNRLNQLPSRLLSHCRRIRRQFRRYRFFAALSMTLLDAGSLFPSRKQQRQREYHARRPGRFAVLAGLSFAVLKLLLVVPAFR